MTKLLKLFISACMMVGLSFSQSGTLEGNVECVGAVVEYTYVARETTDGDEAADYGPVYEVVGSWPSSANPQFQQTLASYQPGDTVTTRLVPLPTPVHLQAAGIGMDVDLLDDGRFQIIEGSTYPTTEADNCSTYSTVPGVQDYGTWTKTPGYTHEDNPLKYSMGWGITLSGIFAQFNAADLVGGSLGTDYGPGTAMENWGMVTITYEDEAHTSPSQLEIYWEANDGPGSGLGIDDVTELLNDYVGVPIATADTVTIDNMDALLAATNPELYARLGWTDGGDGEGFFPVLGGPGNPIDPENPDTYVTHPITGEIDGPSGQVTVNHGYIFDPTGALNGGDGAPFTGDEAMAPTGYFLTYNFLQATQAFTAAFQGALASDPADVQAALTAGGYAVASIYFYDEDAVPAGTSIGQTLYDEYIECATGGGGEACNAVFSKGPTVSLTTVQVLCDYDCGVDDSGYDYDEYYDAGRLVLEIDNACIPDKTTQRVRTYWEYTGEPLVELDEEAPIAAEFKLFGNYPNPFNPETKIKFATERFSNVTVTIYSMLGEQVSVAHNGELSPGTYDVSWYGNDSQGNKVPSGVYFYEVRSDERVQKGKMLLLK